MGWDEEYLSTIRQDGQPLEQYVEEYVELSHLEAPHPVPSHKLLSTPTHPKPATKPSTHSSPSEFLAKMDTSSELPAKTESPALVQPAAVQPVVQSTVVISPMQVVTAIPDYLGYSIFTMLCCCLPLGIAATVFSCHTRDANLSGQQELARSSSRVAFILNNVALGLGLAIITLGIILMFTIRA
ncbi:hypothetical protein Q8A67_021808 [Cirrhinus molitorella]|uniref:Uncharacterized protein n=1 Tax=Cirrhinus molitorella TaxID=172907 RepID=A0AA88PBG6_9TELE|nr:hypothetical protein Q8A67_021808 [Cirrhinus molitorella]